MRGRCIYLLRPIDHVLYNPLDTFELGTHFGTCSHGRNGIVQTCLLVRICQEAITDRLCSFLFAALLELYVGVRTSDSCD
jgi:hypothetical protein